MSYFLWGCRRILTLITLRSERVKAQIFSIHGRQPEVTIWELHIVSWTNMNGKQPLLASITSCQTRHWLQCQNSDFRLTPVDGQSTVPPSIPFTCLSGIVFLFLAICCCAGIWWKLVQDVITKLPLELVQLPEQAENKNDWIERHHGLAYAVEQVHTVIFLEKVVKQECLWLSRRDKYMIWTQGENFSFLWKE